MSHYDPKRCEASVSSSDGWRSHQCARPWTEKKSVEGVERRFCAQHAKKPRWLCARPRPIVEVEIPLTVRVRCESGTELDRARQVLEWVRSRYSKTTQGGICVGGALNTEELQKAQEGVQ